MTIVGYDKISISSNYTIHEFVIIGVNFDQIKIVVIVYPNGIGRIFD
jgi:hypothetical protein